MPDKPHFDVLKEPWIEVEDVATHKKSVISPMQAYRDAKNIQICSDGMYVFEEVVEKLFMVAILADAIYPIGNRGKRRLLQKDGAYLENVVSEYAERCKAEGVSFDLLDEDKPFMQAPLSLFKKDKKGNREVIHVGFLDPFRFSSSNNIFHYRGTFSGKLEDMPEQSHMSFAKFTRALLTYQLISPASGQGYSPGIFTTFSPFFVFPEGENLFETLVYMLPTWEGTDEERGIPAWRRKSYVIPKSGFSPSGFLTDVFMPVQAVRYATVEGEDVTGVYREAIKYRQDGILTTDFGRASRVLFPYFLMKEKPKKGKGKGRVESKDNDMAILAATEERSAIYDVVSSLLNNGFASDVTDGFDGYHYTLESANHDEKELRRKDAPLKYTAYGARLDNGKYVYQKKFDIVLPRNLEDMEKHDAFQQYLSRVKRGIRRIYCASCYAYGTTPEELASKGSGKSLKHIKEKVKDLSDHITSLYVNTMADYYDMHLEKFANIGGDEKELEDWKRLVRRDTETVMENAYVQCTRKVRETYTDWSAGLCVATNYKMGGYMDDGKVMVSSRDKMLKIMSNLRNLQINDLYVLRNACGKPYGSDPVAVKTSRYVTRGLADGRDVEKGYYYATIMAGSVIDERKRKFEPGEDKKLFQDLLIEVHNKSKSGKVTVNRLLMEDDIFSPQGIQLVTQMLMRAKEPINIISLCADLDRWDVKDVRRRTSVKWAMYIGSKISSNEDKDKKENENV